MHNYNDITFDKGVLDFAGQIQALQNVLEGKHTKEEDYLIECTMNRMIYEQYLFDSGCRQGDREHIYELKQKLIKKLM